MSKNTDSKAPLTTKERSKRAFVIFSAIFLSCVLTLGVVFGAIGVVKNASAVMRYKGIYVGEGVSNYLAASYKYDYMSALTRSGVQCYDSYHFWQSESPEGRTYAELLAESTEGYIKRVIVGAYLFDRNTRFSGNDKKSVKQAISEVLNYRADGSIDRFNEIAADMGFTYRDFVKAAELLYKYEMAKTVIFGYDGAALEGGGFGRECDEFFENSYSHVKLMIIRTDGEMVVDPDTGKEVLSEYDDTTKEKINAEISRIRDLIRNANENNEGLQMSEEYFDDLVSTEYSTGTVNDTEGYYFSPTSSYSIEFAKDAPEVVRSALSTEVGKYSECELDIGVCFIYKCELESGAYRRIALTHFFEDFYVLASSYVYSRSLDTYIDGVSVKDKYEKDAVVTRPYNHILGIKFG